MANETKTTTPNPSSFQTDPNLEVVTADPYDLNTELTDATATLPALSELVKIKETAISDTLSVIGTDALIQETFDSLVHDLGGVTEAFDHVKDLLPNTTSVSDAIKNIGLSNILTIAPTLNDVLSGTGFAPVTDSFKLDALTNVADLMSGVTVLSIDDLSLGVEEGINLTQLKDRLKGIGDPLMDNNKLLYGLEGAIDLVSPMGSQFVKTISDVVDGGFPIVEYTDLLSTIGLDEVNAGLDFVLTNGEGVKNALNGIISVGKEQYESLVDLSPTLTKALHGFTSGLNLNESDTLKALGNVDIDLLIPLTNSLLDVPAVTLAGIENGSILGDTVDGLAGNAMVDVIKDIAHVVMFGGTGGVVKKMMYDYVVMADEFTAANIEIPTIEVSSPKGISTLLNQVITAPMNINSVIDFIETEGVDRVEKLQSIDEANVPADTLTAFLSEITDKVKVGVDQEQVIGEELNRVTALSETLSELNAIHAIPEYAKEKLDTQVTLFKEDLNKTITAIISDITQLKEVNALLDTCCDDEDNLSKISPLVKGLVYQSKTTASPITPILSRLTGDEPLGDIDEVKAGVTDGLNWLDTEINEVNTQLINITNTYIELQETPTNTSEYNSLLDALTPLVDVGDADLIRSYQSKLATTNQYNPMLEGLNTLAKLETVIDNINDVIKTLTAFHTGTTLDFPSLQSTITQTQQTLATVPGVEESVSDLNYLANTQLKYVEEAIDLNDGEEAIDAFIEELNSLCYTINQKHTAIITPLTDTTKNSQIILLRSIQEILLLEGTNQTTESVLRQLDNLLQVPVDSRITRLNYEELRKAIPINTDVTNSDYVLRERITDTTASSLFGIAVTLSNDGVSPSASSYDEITPEAMVKLSNRINGVLDQQAERERLFKGERNLQHLQHTLDEVTDIPFKQNKTVWDNSVLSATVAVEIERWAEADVIINPLPLQLTVMLEHPIDVAYLDQILTELTTVDLTVVTEIKNKITLLKQVVINGTADVSEINNKVSELSVTIAKVLDHIERVVTGLSSFNDKTVASPIDVALAWDNFESTIKDSPYPTNELDGIRNRVWKDMYRVTDGDKQLTDVQASLFQARANRVLLTEEPVPIDEVTFTSTAVANIVLNVINKVLYTKETLNVNKYLKEANNVEASQVLVEGLTYTPTQPLLTLGGEAVLDSGDLRQIVSYQSKYPTVITSIPTRISRLLEHYNPETASVNITLFDTLNALDINWLYEDPVNKIYKTNLFTTANVWAREELRQYDVCELPINVSEQLTV